LVIRHFGDVTPEATLAFAGGNSCTVADTPIARNATVLLAAKAAKTRCPLP